MPDDPNEPDEISEIRVIRWREKMAGFHPYRSENSLRSEFLRREKEHRQLVDRVVMRAMRMLTACCGKTGKQKKSRGEDYDGLFRGYSL